MFNSQNVLADMPVHATFKPWTSHALTTSKDSKAVKIEVFTDPFSAESWAMERVLDVHSHKHDRIYPLSEIAKTGVVNDSLDGRIFVIFYHAETVSVLDDKDISKSKQVGSAVAFDARFKEKNLYFSRDGK